MHAKLKRSIYFFMLLSSCQKNMPLDSLASHVQSKQFNLSYWMEQASRHTVLWQQARQICQSADLNAVNCRAVKQAALLSGEAWTAGFGRDEDDHGRY